MERWRGTRTVRWSMVVAALLVLAACTPDGGVATESVGPPAVTFVPTGGDDTLALQVAIQSNPATEIDAPVVVNGRLFLQGLRDRTIVFGPNGRIVRTVLDRSWASLSVFDLALARNVTIANATIVGAQPCNRDGTMTEQPATDKQHAFDVRSSTDVHIVGATVSNLGGDGIYATRLVGFTETTGLVVDRFTASCMGRDGLSLTGDRNDTFTRVAIGAVGQFGIDIEPDAQMTVDQVLVSGVTVTARRSRTPWLSCAGHGSYGAVVVAGVRANGAPDACTRRYPHRITRR